MSVQPFEVNIALSVLEDLRKRLEMTRWPDQIPGAGWDYGTNLEYLKELAEYWRTEFDWKAQEAAINRFANFKTTIDGQTIHFIHERGKGPNPLPLLLSHGWPSTFLEFAKIIPLLTDPASYGGRAEDAFDVIVPSLPGFGFSDRPTERGMTTKKIAELWVRLMTEELGYKKFAAQGGDFGNIITDQIGLAHPETIVGLHMNHIPYTYGFLPAENLSPAEQAYKGKMMGWNYTEGGYAMIQGSKPQTLAYGLNDSPVGLAGWIVEKFRSWSDCDGDLENSFSKDELLANITLYWVTQTISSSVRIYFEKDPGSQGWSNQKPEIPRQQVPVGVAIFPKDILPPPKEFVERWFPGSRISFMPRGGHFAPQEEPELLARDIQEFFRPLR